MLRRKLAKRIALALMAVVTVSCASVAFVGCNKNRDVITIASKDFTEQDILGNMLYIYLSNNTDYKYEYKHEMSSNVVFAAIKSGSADLYIDYTGTVYGNYLNLSEIKPPQETYEISKNAIKEQFNLEMFESLGFNNTYTLSVDRAVAEEHSLTTISDLAKVASQLTLGCTIEFNARETDGLDGITKAYGFNFKDVKTIDGVLRFQAIDKHEVDVIDAFATDGMLEDHDLVTLIDDKEFFPPYYAVPIIRGETLEKYPEIRPLLERLKDVLTDEQMRTMNYKVDVLHENAADVARNFLKDAKLI